MNRLVFLSYARSDGAFALRLAKDLRAAGIEIWIDQLDIRAGDTWDRAVEGALRSCSHLLVVLSPASMMSRSVLDEVSFALEENKTTVPVLLQECEIPFRLRRVQRTDFTADYTAALQRLLAELGVSAAANGAEESAVRAEHPAGDDFGKPIARVSMNRRLVAALWFGLAGLCISAISTAFIYANDPRFNGAYERNSHPPYLLGGGIAAVLCAIAGAIAGPSKRALLAALGGSMVAVVAWILLGGTYQDVLFSAVVFGWPIGGIIGAAIRRFLDRRRMRVESS